MDVATLHSNVLTITNVGTLKKIAMKSLAIQLTSKVIRISGLKRLKLIKEKVKLLIEWMKGKLWCQPLLKNSMNKYCNC